MKRIGYSSSRPASIENVSMIFEIGENSAKLDTGPTSSNPGPILLMVAATAEKAVKKLFVSSAIKKTRNQNTTVKTRKYLMTL